MNFSIAGPDHMGIFISPMHGSSIQQWSFNQNITPSKFNFDGRETFFVYFAYSVDSSAYSFFIDIEVNTNSIKKNFENNVFIQFIRQRIVGRYRV